MIIYSNHLAENCIGRYHDDVWGVLFFIGTERNAH